MIYNASLDHTTKAITALVTILFILIGLFQFLVPQKSTAILIIAGLVTIYVAVLVFRPLRYEIDGNKLYIHRPISNVGIAISRIRSVEPLPRHALGFMIRSFGVGGMFGYFGNFNSSKFGSLTFYATRRDRMVLLKTDDKKYVVTPDDPEGFVSDLNKAIASVTIAL